MQEGEKIQKFGREKSQRKKKNSGEKLKVLKGKIIKEYIAQRDSL